jgi:lauroyl/myristoyl acyltransferase
MDRIDALLKRDGGKAPWRGLAESAARFTARDYPLDGSSDADSLARFDVVGFDAVQQAMARGRGAILVGSHLGAHVAGMHWLFRRDLPIRALVQRPKHVSRELDRRFDSAVAPHPQAEFFLKRHLTPAAAVERMMHARAALRDGLALYLNGDIVWNGSNTRTCRLLGREHSFLAVWAELACLTRAPVFLVFCRHLDAGRFAIEFRPLDPASPARPEQLLSAYLAEVESQVALDPSEAVAYLTWPCYTDAPDAPMAHSSSPRNEPHATPPPARSRRAKDAVTA